MSGQGKTKALALALIQLLLIIALTGAASCSSDTTTTAVPAGSNTTGSSAAGNGAEMEITIKDFSFSPADLTINKGTKVKWTNQDSAPHTATSGDKFDSGRLSKGMSYEFMFNEAGTYNYICTIHPQMKGTVTVK